MLLFLFLPAEESSEAGLMCFYSLELLGKKLTSDVTDASNLQTSNQQEKVFATKDICVFRYLMDSKTVQQLANVSMHAEDRGNVALFAVPSGSSCPGPLPHLH